MDAASTPVYVKALSVLTWMLRVVKCLLLFLYLVPTPLFFKKKKILKCGRDQCWLLWLPAVCSGRLNGSLLRKGGVKKKSTQWMSPLIHFLIKQAAPCHIGCIHAFVLRFGQISSTKSWRALRHCSVSTHARPYTQPIALYKSNPPHPHTPTPPPHGLDRNNKQQMIHDGDGECIQWDHLSDLI